MYRDQMERARVGVGVYPDILAVLALLGLTAVFYYRTAFSNNILVSLDTFTYFYPNESYLADALSHWHLPLWNPYLFTGVPFLANMQTAIFYPFNLLFLVFPVPRAYMLSVTLHVFLAGLFMYIFCRGSLDLGRVAALVGAAAFTFSGFFNSMVGHINQLEAAAWIPLLFLLCDIAYRRRSLRFAVLGGLVLALQFLAGHSQETYLTLFALALFIVYRVVTDGLSIKISALAPVAVVLLLGAGIAAVQLVPSLELTALSIRAGGLSYKESVSFSLPPWLILKSLLPVFGEPPLFSEYLGYVGTFGLFMALLGLATARRSFVWFAAGLAAIALLLALGQYDPIYPLAYKLIPGLDLFRVPARWLFLYTFAMATLAAFGTDYLRVRTLAVKTALGRFIGTILVAGGILLILYLLGRHLAPLEVPGGTTIMAWAVAAVLAIGTIAVSIANRRNLGAIALAAVIVELFVASQTMPLNQLNLPEAYSALRPAVAYFLADPGVYRVLPVSENTYDPGDLGELTDMLKGTLDAQQIYDYIVAAKWKDTLFPNLPLRYKIASIDGYDGGMLPLQSFLSIKKMFPLGENQAPDGRLRDELDGFPDASVLDLLNIKYILMDRIRDAWVDGVYYDLAINQKLDAADDTFTLNVPSSFEATSLGMISYLSGAAKVGNGEVVAWVTVVGADGSQRSYPLRAGQDTAEGQYAAAARQGGVAHPQARKAKAWKDDPDSWDYLGKISLSSPVYPRRITVRFVGQAGAITLCGMTLIDDRVQTSTPVALSPSLKIDYLGDVKIYRNLAVWPRAFIARAVAPSPTNDAPKPGAGADITIDTVPPSATIVATRIENQPNDLAKIVSYAPERVEVKTDVATNAYLVLSDAFYPGWRARVDGHDTPILLADKSLRAVALAPGQHAVDFVYDPGSLKIGAIISVLSLAIALGITLFGMLRRRAKV